MDDKEDIYKLEDDDIHESSENKNDNKNKLIKYGIIGICCFILFIILLAFITSCSNKSKKKLSEELNLEVGDSYTLNYNDFTWKSSNDTIAVVKDNKIEVLKDGDVTITITTSKEIITYALHIKEKNLEVTGVKLSSNTIEMEKDTTKDLTANLIPEKSKSTLSWYSSNESVATVSDGVIKSIAPGTCMITVKTENGYTDTCLVKVTGENSNNPVKSISIDSLDMALNKGTSFPISYKIEPSDSINLVTWESSDPKVATVENGVIYPLGEGKVKITAKSGSVAKSINVEVIDNTVKEKITLNQTNISLYVGNSYTLSTNSKKKVTWTSSDSKIATVESGVVTAKASGTIKIKATSENGNYAECIVEVIEKPKKEENPKEEVVINYTISLNMDMLDMNIGDSTKLVETISPSNNVSDVVWKSSDSTVANVENGVVTALKEGRSIITAELPNGSKAECTVNVNKRNIKVMSVTLNASFIYLESNKTAQLSATILPNNASDKTVKWRSSNSNIAVVDSNGKVTAKSKGRAIIYATSVNGVTDNCEIVVTK